MKTEDYTTTTLDGARGFQQSHAEREEIDYPEAEIWDDDGEEPECNCSDPGCPCSGWKRGGL